MFKKIFGKIKKKKKFALKKVEHAQRDWVTALLVFFIAIVAIVVVNIFIFIQINSIEDAATDDIKDIELIDEELLNETLNFYAEKEDRFMKYQTEVPNAPEI